MDVIHHVTAI